MIRSCVYWINNFVILRHTQKMEMSCSVLTKKGVFWLTCAHVFISVILFCTVTVVNFIQLFKEFLCVLQLHIKGTKIQSTLNKSSSTIVKECDPRTFLTKSSAKSSFSLVKCSTHYLDCNKQTDGQISGKFDNTAGAGSRIYLYHWGWSRWRLRSIDWHADSCWDLYLGRWGQ